MTMDKIVNLVASHEFNKMGNHLSRVEENFEENKRVSNLELKNLNIQTTSILKGRTSSMAHKKRAKKVLVDEHHTTIKPLLATAFNFAPNSPISLNRIEQSIQSEEDEDLV